MPCHHAQPVPRVSGGGAAWGGIGMAGGRGACTKRAIAGVLRVCADRSGGRVKQPFRQALKVFQGQVKRKFVQMAGQAVQPGGVTPWL